MRKRQALEVQEGGGGAALASTDMLEGGMGADEGASTRGNNMASPLLSSEVDEGSTHAVGLASDGDISSSDDEIGGGGRAHPSFSDALPDYLHSARAFRDCTLHFIMYLCVAVIAYSFVFECWSVTDSLYFAVVTFTTVGYGDIIPTNRSGQIFTSFFALYGICIIAVGLGIVGQRVLEQQQLVYDMRRERAKRRLVRIFAPNGEAVAAGSTGSVASIKDDQALEDDIDMVCLSTLKEAFSIIRRVLPLLVFVLMLAVLIGWYEGWSFGTSIYYCIITTSTIGYGDVTPTLPAMRLLDVFFIPASVAVIGQILGQIAGSRLKKEARIAEREFLERELAYSDLEAMDDDGDGKVVEAEFLAFMLVAMSKVDKKSINDIRSLFSKLDVDGSGTLEKEDLELIAQRKWNGQQQGMGSNGDGIV